MPVRRDAAPGDDLCEADLLVRDRAARYQFAVRTDLVLRRADSGRTARRITGDLPLVLNPHPAVSDTCAMATALSKLPYNRGATSDAKTLLAQLDT